MDRQEADPGSVLRFTRDFLRWRSAQDLLKWGGERIHDANDAPLLVFDRFDESLRLVVILNFSLEARFPPIEPEIALLEAPGAVAARSERGVALPPLGFAIGAGRR